MMSKRESIREPTVLRANYSIDRRSQQSIAEFVALKMKSSGEASEEWPGSIDEDSGSKVLTPCNKLQLIIGRGTHITDVSKLTFNNYRDGGLAKHEIQLKSTMGNVVRDA